MSRSVLWFLAVGLLGCTTEPTVGTTEELLSMNSHSGFIPNGLPVQNEYGHSATISTDGRIDLTNEFFQDLGSNGRRCVSCHQPSAGWSITPEDIQNAFDDSDGGLVGDDFGLSAVFRLNDGSVSPNADVSTLANRRAAFSMLLTKGLIRVGIGIPNNAEFVLDAVDDPYGYASAQELSLFRRPLPATNLEFLSTVMWDGRETFKDDDGKFRSIHFDLSDQATGANQGHAQGPPLSDAQRESIVAFETSLYTAQVQVKSVGNLDTNGASGGPAALINQDFYIGINDVFGDPVTGDAFDPNAFDLYDAWTNSTKKQRAQVARGQRIFNTRKLVITGVSGINDDFDVASLDATCSFCHNSPNAGDHSTVAPLDIGIVAESERTPDMPLYVLRCVSGPHAGQVYRVTDPGRALISGQCKDIGRFKGPILRGLAARAPYFHNGSAATLEDVVNFYDRRFSMHLTTSEKADLVAFLATL
jgi:cytochrome c peroxidase